MSAVGTALGMGRRLAESRMTETVTVGVFEMRAASGSLDPVLTLVSTLYSGKARVKYPSASAVVKTPVDQQLAETNIVVSLPSGTVSVPTGHLVRVDASASDSALVGRFFRVKGPAQSGQTTAHRYPVVEES